MTTETWTAETTTGARSIIVSRPLNLPTAEQVRRNLAAICRDQIIGAAKAGKEERLDYWLARYVELVAGQAPRQNRPRRPALVR